MTEKITESEILQEINAGGDSDAPTLPTGNKTETEIDTVVTPPKGRGRPKGTTKDKAEKEKETSPPIAPKVKQEDFLTPIINSSLIPIAAKRLKRKAEQLQYTEAEMKMLSALKPSVSFDEPSWPAYIITAVSIVIVHYFGTEAEKAPDEKKAEETKPLTRQAPPDENRAGI